MTMRLVRLLVLLCICSLAQAQEPAAGDSVFNPPPDTLKRVESAPAPRPDQPRIAAPVGEGEFWMGMTLGQVREQLPPAKYDAWPGNIHRLSAWDALVPVGDDSVAVTLDFENERLVAFRVAADGNHDIDQWWQDVVASLPEGAYHEVMGEPRPDNIRELWQTDDFELTVSKPSGDAFGAFFTTYAVEFRQ